MQQRRWVILLGVAAAVVALVAYGMMPRRVVVDAAKVTRGPLRVTVEEEGKTRVKDRFVVSAPVAGFVRRITFDVGDKVARGQVVAQLEPLRSTVLDPRSRAEAEARVEAAKAALDAAKENARVATASYDYARAKYDRTKRLHESGFASKDEWERGESETRQARATLKSSEFAVKVARSDLEAARTQLLYSSGEGGRGAGGKVAVRAPVEGSVLGIPHKDEGVVEAGRPLIEIGNPRALEVEVDVLSSDAVRIRPGTTVHFDRWGGDGLLEGKVRIVEPAGFTKVSALGVEEQRVLVIADITSPPALWEQLGDGYRLEASFLLWEGDDILQVPASALFRYEGGWAAFAVDGGKAKRRTVTVGRHNGLVAQVLSGLAEGEMVISHPSDKIEDGTRIRNRKR
jgi:HlyD family secretion protein